MGLLRLASKKFMAATIIRMESLPYPSHALFLLVFLPVTLLGFGGKSVDKGLVSA